MNFEKKTEMDSSGETLTKELVFETIEKSETLTKEFIVFEK